MYSYNETLITHYLHNILFTIKPEGSGRETAKQEQKEKVQPAFRSSVSKQLQYIDIGASRCKGLGQTEGTAEQAAGQ
jgi:hypothetical protein